MSQGLAGRLYGSYSLIVLVCFCAVVAWLIAAAGLSTTLTDRNVRLAAAFDAGSALVPLALAGLTETGLPDDKPAAYNPSASKTTRELAVAALKADPLSATAFRQLARAAQEAGNTKAASAYLAEAYRRFFRQPEVTVQLLVESIGASDMTQTITLLDALLRAAPSRLKASFPLLAAVAKSSALRPVLVSRLAANPIWRSDFLDMLGKSEADEAAMLDLFTALSATSAPMTRLETIWFVFELAKREHIDAALGIWYSFLPPATVAAMPLLYNGDFSLPTNDSPFNWTIEQPSNAVLKVVDVAADEKALAVEFTGRRGAFAPVYQHTTLVPGTYRLTGRIRTDDFRNQEGLVWAIYCGWAKRSKIAQTGRLFDTGGAWRTFSLEFNVPAADCSEQNVRLELPAATESRQVATGSVWFSQMAIAPN